MKAFIDKCEDYESCQNVIEEAFSELGGIDKFVSSGETILLKPNLLQGSEPSESIVTHPDFVIGVIKALEEKNIDIIVGDSPGGPMSERRMKKVYDKSGYLRIEDETNARLNYDTETKVLKHDGRVKKSFKFLKVAHEVDGIINLPKLKTHSLTVFTGAVKNHFGLINGLTKSAYHGQFKKLNDFGKVLLDISDAAETRVSLMDGIWGMEGNGPSSGAPINLQAIIGAEDPLVCDHAACKTVGIPTKKVPTLLESDYEEEEIKYLNRPPSFFETDIDYPSGGSTPWWAPDILADLFSNFYLDRPTLEKEKCIQCWKCEEICPNDAIKMKSYGPKISWFNCIRCYCCAEVCPKDALRVEE